MCGPECSRIVRASWWAVALTVVCAGPALAIAPEQPTAEKMTNVKVIEIRQLGLGDDVILEKIRASSCEFDVSLEGLKRLKAADVSNAVISEMIRVSKKTSDDQGVARTDHNDPMTPHDPGIYYVEESGPSPRLVLLEPTVYTQAKSGGFFKMALTYGIAKAKSKAVLNGSHAQLRVQGGKPTFYFYFETTSAGLGGSGFGYFSVATSANEFVLVRTEVKKVSRELVIGQFNYYGSQSGLQDKSMVPFDFEKLSPGVYKVVPKNDLEGGEYCFFYGGSTPMATYGMLGSMVGGTGGGKVFDFGVSAN
jgi:hypothetical protein